MLARSVVAPPVRTLAGCRTVDDVTLGWEPVRAQALWILNTARAFTAETDRDQARELWSQVHGVLDGADTIEEITVLLAARSTAATLLVVRLLELVSDQTDIPMPDLFDQVQSVVLESP